MLTNSAAEFVLDCVGLALIPMFCAGVVDDVCTILARYC